MARDKKNAQVVVEIAPVVSPIGYAFGAQDAGLAASYILFANQAVAEARAAQAIADATPEPATPAILSDDWHFEAGNTEAEAHIITLRLMAYGIPACDPKHPFMVDDAPMPLSYAMCAYCADGTLKPANAPKAAKAPRAARAPAKPVLTDAELEAQAETRNIARQTSIATAVQTMRVSLDGLVWDHSADMPIASPTSPTRTIEIIEACLAELRTVRASFGKSGKVAGSTGPKAPRQNRSTTVRVASDTPELATIRELARLSGDKRAVAIIEHVDSWVDADGKMVSTKENLPGGVCSFCHSEKHLRRTGFYSATLTINAIEARVGTLASLQTAEANTPETSDDAGQPDDVAPESGDLESLPQDTADDSNIEEELFELPEELRDAVLEDVLA